MTDDHRRDQPPTEADASPSEEEGREGDDRGVGRPARDDAAGDVRHGVEGSEPGLRGGADPARSGADDAPDAGASGAAEDEGDDADALEDGEDEDSLDPEDEDETEATLGDGSDEDPDEAVDTDEPDEDAPRIRRDEHLDPAERAALEAAAVDLDAEPTEEEAPVEAEPEIALDRLDPDALKVVRRLRRFGHEAYLVGGCVRDLLIGVPVKDFDVATSARPEQTKEAFTNCRLIGRRFRLAHIYFRGGKVIETATFRRSPRDDESGEGGDLYITEDNVYGTAEEDARRRDFTLNGLFYDPAAGRVIDYVGGRADLDAGVIRTVGEPAVRMPEDPVRILRAVRFAAKLSFRIDPATWEAMRAHAADIPRCPPPRVLEEILRLLRSGASRGAFALLRDLGALEVLLPPIAEHLAGADPEDEGRFWALLDAVDEWVRIHEGPPDDAVLLAALLSTLFTREGLPTARSEALDDILQTLVRDARLPRRVAERVRLILGAQRVFAGQRKRRFSPRRFVRQSYIPDALVLLDIRVRATGDDADQLPRWRERLEANRDGVEADEAGANGRRRGGRRRRRRGGGGRKGS